MYLNCLRDFEKAVEEYTKAIELNPLLALAYYNRASARNEMTKGSNRTKEDIDIIIADYTKAIEINPDFAGAYFNIGNIYSGMSDLKKALQYFRKVVEIKPEVAEDYVKCGLAYLHLSESDNALMHFTKTILLDTNNPTAYHGLIS